MKEKWLVPGCVALLLLSAVSRTVSAGDSVYGKVIRVHDDAAGVVFDYGPGQFDVRMIGIKVDPAQLAEAKALVSRRLLQPNEHARIRLGYRGKHGEIVARLFSEDPQRGITDVGLELVNQGYAVRDLSYDYKFHELSKAQKDAKTAGRGRWKRR